MTRHHPNSPDGRAVRTDVSSPSPGLAWRAIASSSERTRGRARGRRQEDPRERHRSHREGSRAAPGSWSVRLSPGLCARRQRSRGDPRGSSHRDSRDGRSLRSHRRSGGHRADDLPARSPSAPSAPPTQIVNGFAAGGRGSLLQLSRPPQDRDLLPARRRSHLSRAHSGHAAWARFDRTLREPGATRSTYPRLWARGRSARPENPMSNATARHPRFGGEGCSRHLPPPNRSRAASPSGRTAGSPEPPTLPQRSRFIPVADALRHQAGRRSASSSAGAAAGAPMPSFCLI